MPDQIELVKPDSNLLPLFKVEPLVSVTKAEQVQDLLGQDVVRLTVESVDPIDLNIRSKVLMFGRWYTLNQLPTAEKKGERHFVYDINLEGPQYDLRKPVYFNTDVSGFNTSPDFSLTGDVESFLDVLIYNANRVFGSGTWIKGSVPSTGVKTISFNENNCFSALQTFCKEFRTEFEIIESGGNHTINIKKIGQVLGHTYEYGRAGGLYQLKRQTVTESDIITRLYPYGASKNLRPNYRDFSQRLRLADPGYIEDSAAIATFGLIEATYVNEEIFPQRVGTVSGVSGQLTFSDASMSFDLNETDGSGTKYLLAGTSAKIHFNSGNLAGYEFELAKYVHGTKTFTLIQTEDERGLILPNPTEAAFQINVGDEYVILDIMLPDSYVESAELELATQAQVYLDQNKYPKVQYSLEVDEMYLRQLYPGDTLVNPYGIGDYIQIKDDELNINKSSRIIGMVRDILHPYKYNLTIDDTYEVSMRQVIIETQKEVKNIIKVGQIRDVNRLRMGWMTTQELLRKIFDPDNYFDGGKIRPETVETLALVVGAKSQQFVLQNIVFEPNYGGNTNVVHVSPGYLVHYAIADTVKTWTIGVTDVTIPDNASRYIYAKVNKTNLAEGYIVFDSAQILPDEDPTFYHFLVGMLHTAIDGVRWISLTYGATAINGRFIKTGRIQSFDGNTYFDLDLGQIGGYIRFRDAQGNSRDLADIGADTDMFWKMAMINTPESYVAGFATNWFQVADPATWPGGEEAYHDGDNWFNPGTGFLYRRIGGAWVWDAGVKEQAAFELAYTRVGDDSKIRTFTAEPVGPYGTNDLWMSPDGLRRSIGTRVTGFDPNHWVIPFNFDNTETAINGGVLTSGTIQLAGDNYTVMAGMSGKGKTEESVFLWGGAATENMATAPLRLFMGGWIKSRKYIEVEGWNAFTSEYEGQAWMAGWGGPGVDDDGWRLGVGSTYEDRANAPFRANREGFVWMEKAQIGNMQIRNGGLTNTNSAGTFVGDAAIILRDDSRDIFAGIGTNLAPASLGYTIVARFENNEVNTSIGHRKIAAYFGASGGSHASAMNYAIYASPGISMLGEALINGRRSISIGIPSGTTQQFDPTLWDLITILPPVGPPCRVQLTSSGHENVLYNGKEVTIMSTNNAASYFIMNTIRGNPSAPMPAGTCATLVFMDGYWYVKCLFDNTF